MSEAKTTATTRDRFPYDRGTSAILDLIRDKHDVPAKGIVRLILKECPYWKNYCKDYNIHGAAFTIGRRLTRMRKANLIQRFEHEGVEYYS